MHGRKKAQRLDMAAGERGFHLGDGGRRRRIHHHVSVKALGMLAHGGHHRFAVAGNARDQCSFFDAMSIKFLGPNIGQLPGICGRQLPVQDRRQRVHRDALLFSERSEKRCEKKWTCASATGSSPQGVSIM